MLKVVLFFVRRDEMIKERRRPMDCIQRIDKDIYWVGGSDRRLALFENMFPLDNGVTYNAYMIVDEKTALVDTVDNAIRQQFFDNLIITDMSVVIGVHDPGNHLGKLGRLHHIGTFVNGHLLCKQFLQNFHRNVFLLHVGNLVQYCGVKQ